MTNTVAASTAHHSYRHEAVFYRGNAGFLAESVPFVLEGIRAGQPVMVAVPNPRLDLLRDALGADAAKVLLVDMEILGRNPARIIPAWLQFLEEHSPDGQPARGIGEPVWNGRLPAELSECQLHESLLNVAVSPDTPLWLRCPYDKDALDETVLLEAHRSHPTLVDEDMYLGSRTYGGAAHVDAAFAQDLPEPDAVLEELTFDLKGLAAVRPTVLRYAVLVGVSPPPVDLALAVHEIATNSIEHGGGSGTLRIWLEHEGLVCEIRDDGKLDDPLVGRRLPSPHGTSGRGLWMAHQLCDLVQVRATASGTVVRMTIRRL